MQAYKQTQQTNLQITFRQVQQAPKEFSLFVFVLCHSVMPDSLQTHDCSLPGSSVHRDSPGKNTGVGCHALLQGIFPTQGSNPGLPHCRQVLYCLSHQGGPRILEWVAYPSPVDLHNPGIKRGSPALQVDSLPAELPGKPLFFLKQV